MFNQAFETTPNNINTNEPHTIIDTDSRETRRRSTFLSKLPFVSCIKIYYFHFIVVHYRFFHKSEKPKKPQARRLKMFEIYRFADKLDIFLMIIGTIAG